MLYRFFLSCRNHLPGMLLAFTASSAFSQCLTSTDYKVELDSAMLEQEWRDEEGGRYSAELKNGDLLMLRFETCGVGRQAHYFSRQALDAKSVRERMGFLFAALLDESSSRMLGGQLQSASQQEFEKGLEFGPSGTHFVRLDKSPTAAFAAVLSYNWGPAEGMEP